MDFFTNYKEYHLKVVDILKTALYKKDSNIFSRIDFYDDELYKEPLLFSAVNSSNFYLWIDSIALGLSKEKSIFNNVKIRLNNGTLYIPSIGIFDFKNINNSIIEVCFMNNEYVFKLNGTILEYDFKEIKKTKEGIEFLEFNHPLLKELFINEKGETVDVKITSEECYKEKYIVNFNKALLKIESTYKQYYDLIKEYIKKVVFYKGEPNSFATIQAHGIAFFNVSHGNSEIFFLDNILHQCAHVFFNTLTFNKSELFKIPHNSDLSLFTENENDKGFQLYDRFHGLFTQTNINICFDRCLEQKIYSGETYIEFVAKFTSNMTRFTLAIEKFDKIEKYSDDGLKWFHFFKSAFRIVNYKNQLLLERYEVSNQPYIFDYELFKETNKL
jgi:hypothetical protein